MAYPPAPWHLHGQLWLSLFRVRAGEHPERPAGVYGAAFVRYEDPSPLTYAELLVARPAGARVDLPGRRRPSRAGVTVTDIWVDSPDSRDGGRELWAIPKDLCRLDGRSSGSPVQRTVWSASLGERGIARARFSDVSRTSPRAPLRGATAQRRDDGEPVVAPVSGSARVLPCRGSWDFDEAGPLGWLAGKRPLASFRAADFSLVFG